MVAAGIDIGSLWAKAVLVEDNQIKGSAIEPTGMRMLNIAERVFQGACQKAGISRTDVDRIVATGYGRVIVPWATKSVTEITCHARGIHWLSDSIRTVIDIGGQDVKVIRLNSDGDVVNFVMSDKCAAGTGRFVEVMANAIGVSLEEMALLSLKSTQAVHISSICTVFAESEVISLASEGTPIEDIVAGIYSSIAERVYNLTRRVGIQLECAMSGGLGKNIGMVRALEKRLDSKLWVAPEPQLVGAIGAALIAASL